MSVDETNNFLFDVFIVLANLGLGVFLASFFVAYVVYLPLLNGDEEFINSTESYLSITEDEESCDDKEEEVPYDRKYIKELEEIEENEFTKDELKNMKKIIENTDNYGDVLMIYDSDFEYFKYYCNKKDIPHKILETVARKFCIENNCKQIYVDMNKELYKLNKKLVNEEILKREKDKQNEIKSVESEDESQSVFATFKKYNNSNKVVKDEKTKLIKERINVFKYSGRIEDYTIDSIKKPSNDKVLKLDFASFKQMMSESQEKKKLA